MPKVILGCYARLMAWNRFFSHQSTRWKSTRSTPWLSYADLTEEERIWLAGTKYGSAGGENSGQKKPEIRAQLIHQQLSGRGALYMNHHGVTPVTLELENWRIVGKLDLEGVESNCSLSLYDCELPNGISLRETQARTIRMRRCHLSHIEASQLDIHGDFDLADVEVDAGVALAGAIVRGNLILSGTFRAGAGKTPSIDAGGAEVHLTWTCP
jgi:hypothetical protein